MKCLVTGGAGFIGSNLVDELINKKHEVIVIDNESSDAHEMFYWNDKAKNYKCDITDYDECLKVFKTHEPDIIFHLAAEARIQPSISNPLKSIKTNIIGTAIILELSKQYNIKKFIYSSTSSAYGLKNKSPLTEDMPIDCLNPYATSKVSGEELCKLYYNLYGLKTFIFRYFNVYGHKQPLRGSYATVIGIFQKQKQLNQKLTVVGDGEQRRDFTNVIDIVKANILAMETNDTNCYGEIYNVGTGINYSMNEIVDFIEADKNNIIYLPQRLGEARETLANNNKLKNLFNWVPEINLLEWLKNNK